LYFTKSNEHCHTALPKGHELSDERDERTFIFKVVNPLQDTVQIAFELQKDVTISVVEPDLATGAPQTCYTANASMS